MSAAQNKALVRRYYEEMWDRWDFPLADELIDEAIVFRGSLGTEVRGREGFKEYMRAVRRAFPDFRNHIEELISEDERVVARLTYTGTHHGELFGIAATGRRVSYAGVAVFQIAGGRIREGWVLGDLHGLVRQLADAGPGRAGAEPASPTGPRIRDCRPDDVDAVLTLWREAGAAASITDTAANLGRVIADSRAVVLVAEWGGRVVGSVIGSFDGWRGNFYRLAVHPEFRRQGIARSLVAEVERRLAGQGAERLTALVLKDHAWATGFWAAAGYQQDHRVVRFVRNLHP